MYREIIELARKYFCKKKVKEAQLRESLLEPKINETKIVDIADFQTINVILMSICAMIRKKTEKVADSYKLNLHTDYLDANTDPFNKFQASDSLEILINDPYHAMLDPLKQHFGISDARLYQSM